MDEECDLITLNKFDAKSSIGIVMELLNYIYMNRP